MHIIVPKKPSDDQHTHIKRAQILFGADSIKYANFYVPFYADFIFHISLILIYFLIKNWRIKKLRGKRGEDQMVAELYPLSYCLR